MTRHPRVGAHVSVLVCVLLFSSTGCQAELSALPAGLVTEGSGASPVVSDLLVPEENLPAHSDARDGAKEGSVRVLERYLHLTDLITAEGGDEPERIREVVSDQWYPVEYRGFADYREGRFRTLGITTADTVTLTSARWTPAGLLEVHAVACVDASRVWILDQDAQDPPEDLLQWLLTTPVPEVTDELTLEAWQVYLDEVAPRVGRREPVSFWFVGDSAASLQIDGAENWVGVNPCALEQEIPE